MIRRLALYAALSFVIIVVLAWLLGLIFASPADRHAIRVSAAIAWPLQLLGFAIARLLAPTNVLAGWGVGMLMRFAALIVYALVILKPFALPPAAALISLVTFFFVSTLLEPPLLKS